MIAGYVLCNPTEVLLEDIADKKQKQWDIALTYRLAMIAEQSGDNVDWRKVNEAIISRWSKAGLRRVKEMAWNGKR